MFNEFLSQREWADANYKSYWDGATLFYWYWLII